MYIAESGRSGIVTRARLSDKQPSKDYNIWEEGRWAGRRKQEGLRVVNLQTRTQQKKNTSVMALYETACRTGVL